MKSLFAAQPGSPASTKVAIQPEYPVHTPFMPFPYHDLCGKPLIVTPITGRTTCVGCDMTGYVVPATED